MIILAVVDDNNGMLFNKRRQSQDRVLRQQILSQTQETCLWMNSYSYKQFSKEISGDETGWVKVDEAFLNEVGQGEFCFVENVDILPYLERIEKIILFKWNRVYPADCYFPIDLSGWRLMETEEFIGSSHEKITKEVYIYGQN